MRFTVPALASFALAGCIAPVRGESSTWNHIVLVELFTSQGCSSCPAADALVAELPGLGYTRDKVLPLTFHVNYWDDLGWKDPFSSPTFTARQRWYADSGQLRSPDVHTSAREIYTPQMVLDGRMHFSGARRTVALTELQRAASTVAALSIGGEARRQGDWAMVTVRAAGDARLDPSWRLFVALAAKRARTPVSGGENEGRTLEEADVVRTLSEPLPLRLGQASVVSLAKPASLPWPEVEIVAFAQSLTSRQIVGAGAVKLQP
jgi:hypothetical protein